MTSTKRVVKVARLLSEGRRDRDIALRLGVSLQRIKRDVQTLRRLIGARTRIDLAVQLRGEYWTCELFIIGLAQLLTSSRRDEHPGQAWTRDQRRILEKLSTESGTPVPDLIRCAIDAYLEQACSGTSVT